MNKTKQNKTTSKINQFVKSGELIPLQKLISKLPIQQQKKIEEKARYIQIAMAVRKLRKQLKLTQKDLANKLNSKREYISRVESGKQNITLETLYQIAEVTNKKLDFKFI